MDDTDRIDRLEMRVTEQDSMLEDLNRTVTEQWRVIDRLTRTLDALRDQVEEAASRTAPGAPEKPPPHY